MTGGSARAWRFSQHTTIGVGGEAEAIIAADEAHIRREVARSTPDELLVLGGGSNLLVSDRPYPGRVLCIRTQGVEVLEADGAHVRLRVAAGEPLDSVVAYTVSQGWGGLESLSGIPGRMGATPVQNVGAYGHEISEVLRSVSDVSYGTGCPTVRLPGDLGFGYRMSAYKRDLQAVVLSVDLELTTGGLSAPIRFGPLTEALGVAGGARVPVEEVRREVLRLRRSKGMVYDPADPDTHSCGSFFVNPIVPETTPVPEDAPRWRLSDGRMKLSAAWLIDHAGIHRGFRLPGSRAGVSTRHTLALTNRGGAGADEIVALASHIREQVQRTFGVQLVPEPRFVGLALDEPR